MNSRKTQLFTFITLFFVSLMCNAVDVVECKDENGNRGFFKHCPPNMEMIDKKTFNVGSKEKIKEKKKTAIKVTHYYAPNCGVCEQVRDFFKSRDINVNEKNVSENQEVQGELSALTGELRIPTIVIGDAVMTGYDRIKLLDTLEKAGWKEKE